MLMTPDADDSIDYSQFYYPGSISICLTSCSCSIHVKEFSSAGLTEFYISVQFDN